MLNDPMTDEELMAQLAATPSDAVEEAEGEESAPVEGFELDQPETPPDTQPPAKSAEELAAEIENLQRALREERESKKSEREMFLQVTEKLSRAQQERQQFYQPIPQEDELDEDDKYWLSKAERFLKPHLERLEQLHTQQQTQSQQQQQFAQYDMLARQYKAQNPEFEPAVKHFGERLQKKAEILFEGNPQLQQAYVQQQVVSAMQFSPDQLFKYIVAVEGYQPGGNSRPATPAAGASGASPKSLAAVPGASPSRPMSLQEKAQQILDMDRKSLLDLDEREFEKLLRSFKE